MRFLGLLSALLLVAACATTPKGSGSVEDREVVLGVVLDFFDVIESGDADAGARLVMADAVFSNVRIQDGEPVVGHFSNADWLDGLAGKRDDWYEAFTEDPIVLVEGDVAVVWGRYVFEVNGETSHVGTDAFNLVRTADGWRIAGGAYTVEF